MERCFLLRMDCTLNEWLNTGQSAGRTPLAPLPAAGSTKASIWSRASGCAAGGATIFGAHWHWRIQEGAAGSRC